MSGARGSEAPVRFAVAADGTVSGNDGEGGLLAASMRYVSRMAGQATGLLGLGRLAWVRTLGERAVVARTQEIEPGRFLLSVEVSPPHDGGDTDLRGRVSGIRGNLRECLQGASLVLGSEWLAIMTEDKRLVAATDPDHPGGTPHREILQGVGERALAVLGALAEPYRETAVVLAYEHGDLVVAAVGDHALFGVTHGVDAPLLADVVDAVRRSLEAVDLEFAPLVPRPSAPVGGESVEAYVAALSDLATGVRPRRRRFSLSRRVVGGRRG